jgi:hypothetical protein
VRQQLRLKILVPVAVLGLLGAGVGAFAGGKPPDTITVPPPTTTATTPTTTAAKPPPPKKKKEPARPSGPSAERVLRSHRITVVVFYTPEAGVDTAQVREARAGALSVDAGFLALDVTKPGSPARLASRFEVRMAPAVLVVVRGRRVAAHFDGYVDRETVAQAVANSRR